MQIDFTQVESACLLINGITLNVDTGFKGDIRLESFLIYMNASLWLTGLAKRTEQFVSASLYLPQAPARRAAGESLEGLTAEF
ncbi:MAG: hypothetical protein ACK5TQ_21515 [Acetobacteraceae bacterium]